MYKQITIYDLLEILSKKLGPQNWWPAENTEDMLSGMILIQNTNWKNAEFYVIYIIYITYYT
ncbi:hypothetical protein BHL89_05360 [Limosilactobacillus reuteri]|uniref:hypothetical protein n=1 Tax=Limosilactobacillus reuteri TaxID=1598 RepID=UPI000A2E8CAF|nr:hypothetical protein [Limosilactobacillus reuteri]OTA46618.1 hypothetical protein BHL89_05360 [Limosilactobacillus reuteri]